MDFNIRPYKIYCLLSSHDLCAVPFLVIFHESIKSSLGIKSLILFYDVFKLIEHVIAQFLEINALSPAYLLNKACYYMVGDEYEALPVILPYNAVGKPVCDLCYITAYLVLFDCIILLFLHSLRISFNILYLVLRFPLAYLPKLIPEPLQIKHFCEPIVVPEPVILLLMFIQGLLLLCPFHQPYLHELKLLFLEEREAFWSAELLEYLNEIDPVEFKYPLLEHCLSAPVAQLRQEAMQPEINVNPIPGRKLLHKILVAKF